MDFQLIPRSGINVRVNNIIIYSQPWVSSVCRYVEVDSRSWTYGLVCSMVFTSQQSPTWRPLDKLSTSCASHFSNLFVSPLESSLGITTEILSSWTAATNHHHTNCRYQNYRHMLPTICLTSPFSNHAQLPLLNSAVNQHYHLCSPINTNSLNHVLCRSFLST